MLHRIRTRRNIKNTGKQCFVTLWWFFHEKSARNLAKYSLLCLRRTINVYSAGPKHWKRQCFYPLLMICCINNNKTKHWKRPCFLQHLMISIRKENHMLPNAMFLQHVVPRRYGQRLKATCPLPLPSLWGALGLGPGTSTGPLLLRLAKRWEEGTSFVHNVLALTHKFTSTCFPPQNTRGEIWVF